MLSGLDITEDCQVPWAADNDCFSGFDRVRYMSMLDAITYRSNRTLSGRWLMGRV
jgi:hypothetical protein